MIQVISFFKGKQFDITTQEGRSQKRYWRVLWTAFTAAASSGINFITLLITVPLTIQYLGTERFGLWSTMSSLVAVWGFIDLGIANGLINLISDADGREKPELASHLISTAFFLLIAIAVIFGVIFLFLYPWIAWQKVYHVLSRQAILESGPATAIFFVIFLINLPLGIVQRVQMGFQEGFARNMWVSAGSLAGLMGVLLAIYYKAGLPFLVLALAGTPVLVTLVNNIVYFGFQRPLLRPHLRGFEIASAKVILKTGFLYFALQIAAAFCYQSGNIIIAQFFGAEQVTQYSVPMRLFSIFPLIVSFFFNPLWPAYSEALARNDGKWIQNTFWRSLGGGLAITVLPTVCLVFFGTSIIQLWAGKNILPPMILLIGLGIQNLLSCFNGALAMLMNGARIIEFQVITAIIMGGSSILLSIFLVQRIGFAGVVWGSILAQICITIIPSFVYLFNKQIIWKNNVSLPLINLEK